MTTAKRATAAMTPDQRRALAELRFEYAPVPEDIWRPLPHHVEGLQPSAEQAALDALGDAERSTGPSPLGLVLSGQRGAGKTHLLGFLRQQVQTRRGYFFLVGLLDAASFWESVVACMLDGLTRPWRGQDYSQAKVLMHLLCERLVVPDEQHRNLIGIGEHPVTTEALDDFSKRFRAFDRPLAQRCGMTARAMALFVARDPEQQEIAEAYLRCDPDDLDLRPQWGLPSAPRLPEELVGELTMLMALSGPVVIAVDQIDTLLAQSARAIGSGSGDSGLGDNSQTYLLVEQVAGGLMSLRERTRRTLTVVACLPGSWQLIKDHATDTAQDRFRETRQLQTIPTADLGRELVAKRFALGFNTAGFTPPSPTWPIEHEAFKDAVDLTPRHLLRQIDHHLRACEHVGQISPLCDFRAAPDPTNPIPPPPTLTAKLAELDDRFKSLQAEADPAKPLDAATEDKEMPSLLDAGLKAWVIERGPHREQYSVDPAPGDKPSLHARLRQTIDDETEDQLHWSFRAIGKQHATAVLSRLRKACSAAAVNTKGGGRQLSILRREPWSSGAKTAEAVRAFESVGGQTLAPTDHDLQALVALRELQDTAPDHLDEWLVSRQVATELGLFKHIPATPRSLDGLKPVGDSAGAVPIGRAVDGGGGVAIALHALRAHVAIFAGTGSGKTVLIRRLVEECALQGVSAIVLDPNNDLARLGDPWPEPPSDWAQGDPAKAKKYLDDTEVVIWTPRWEGGRPLTFQPLPDFGSVVDNPDEFNAAVEVAVAAIKPRVNLQGKADKAKKGEAVLRKAIEYYGQHGGSDLRTFARLLTDLPDGVSNLKDAPKIGANLSELLIAAMVNDPLFGGDGTPLDPGVLLTPTGGKRARVSVVSFVGLPSTEAQQGFVNQLQMALFAWVKNNPAKDRPLSGLFVMDEAQNFAPSGALTACTQSTLALASQARKYGLGLVFATQAPKGMHNNIPGNAATQFYGRLNAPVQVEAAQQMAAAKGGTVDDISRLTVGQFYAALGTGSVVKLKAPVCLSHHPLSPLTTEEVVGRAAQE